MNTAPLLGEPNLLQVERAISDLGGIAQTGETASRTAFCPRCHSPSAHLHTRYVRQLADLPWLGIAVQLEIQARRLYCRYPDCSQRIFCERLPTFVAPYARGQTDQSQRLVQAERSRA